jgi:hypothetical protein
LVGAFRRTLGGRPKTKGFENPFQNNPTPCKNKQKPTPNSGVQSKNGLCPKSTRKNKKNGKNNRKNGFSGKKWGKNEKLAKWAASGRWVDWREAGGGVAVVGEKMDGGGLVYFGC